MSKSRVSKLEKVILDNLQTPQHRVMRDRVVRKQIVLKMLEDADTKEEYNAICGYEPTDEEVESWVAEHGEPVVNRIFKRGTEEWDELTQVMQDWTEGESK